MVGSVVTEVEAEVEVGVEAEVEAEVEVGFKNEAMEHCGRLLIAWSRNYGTVRLNPRKLNTTFLFLAEQWYFIRMKFESFHTDLI